jgi:hypothetical protein
MKAAVTNVNANRTAMSCHPKVTGTEIPPADEITG